MQFESLQPATLHAAWQCNPKLQTVCFLIGLTIKTFHVILITEVSESFYSTHISLQLTKVREET